MLKTQIGGPGDKRTAHLVEKSNVRGLAVYTDRIKTFDPETKFYSNPDNGINLAVDGSFSGTPIEVHNGIVPARDQRPELVARK